ncbi:MAG TPA: L,D-transpeptidase family protein [Nitrospirota bacterium]|nr:L,D-transpeptidase family protein [Nitrospirota bacterium]
MKSIFRLIIIFAFLYVPGFAAGGEAFHYGKQKEVLGRVGRYTVSKNESLYEIARWYKTGFNEIVAANPGVDPYIPGKGRTLILPTAWVLPDSNRNDGIVINVSETRLYYFYRHRGSRLVKTYPIGIGDEGADTPEGKFKVTEKIVHPAWHVPASIRKEKPELREVVPPGPNNPMGDYALRLSLGTVLIHGTDVPWGIGKRVSHGCIRLYPEDIKELFHSVPLGTKVTIIKQPVKAGLSGDRVYVQVNEDSEWKTFDYLGELRNLLRKKGLMNRVNPRRLEAAVRKKTGYAVDVSLNQKR